MNAPGKKCAGMMSRARLLNSHAVFVTLCFLFGAATMVRADSITIDIEVDHRGGDGVAKIWIGPPSSTPLFSGNFSEDISFNLAGLYTGFGVDAPGIWEGQVWAETGLFFGPTPTPEDIHWPFYWFAFQGHSLTYRYLGDYTEAQAGQAVCGHVYVPLATRATPNPGGIPLQVWFPTQSGGSLEVSAYVHTRAPDDTPTLPILAFALGVLLIIARPVGIVRGKAERGRPLRR
jgi:hypothetical protein